MMLPPSGSSSRLDGEYQVLGLASYGNPKTYARQFAGTVRGGGGRACRTTALARVDFGGPSQFSGPAS